MAVSEVSGFSGISRFSRFSRFSSLSRLYRFYGKSGISCPPASQKAGFHFALLSPCTIFALTFHTYIYLRLW